jgi:uncharacterized membrane protein YfcA
MNALALLGAVAIGLSLGLTGAGGSILTLPVLVYFAGIPPREAIGLSLFIVGTAALVGAIQRGRAGEVHMKAAGLFVISGMVGAALGARLTYLLSPGQLMSVFAVLMVVVAVKMLLPGKELPVASSECRPVRCLFAGAGVGVLTGFLGVGGGFLLMPALAKFARLPLRVATGTSLAVIACNSAAGFVSHLGEAPTPWLLAGVFSLIAGVGVFVGGKVAARLPEKVLRQTFAVLVLVTAGFVFWKGYKDGSDKPPSPTALAADLSISRIDHEGHLELRRMEWQPAKLPLRASRRLPGGTERSENFSAWFI